MTAWQMLLLPDPRPLVEKLGAAFFQSAPATPGIYMMRDAAGVPIYVGKAKDLRKRLCSYRVANPERMRKRHLRLLSRVMSIELETCESEAAALDREAHLIRTLKPRFNRAGTWQGPARFLAWRSDAKAVVLAVRDKPTPEEYYYGPLGVSAFYLRSVLMRLLWSAFNPGRHLANLPAGWFAGRHEEESRVLAETLENANQALAFVTGIFAGDWDTFERWLQSRSEPICLFDKAARREDLDTLRQLIEGMRRKTAGAAPLRTPITVQ